MNLPSGTDGTLGIPFEKIASGCHRSLYFLSWSSIIISTLTMVVLWPDVEMMVLEMGVRGNRDSSSGSTRLVSSLGHWKRLAHFTTPLNP